MKRPGTSLKLPALCQKHVRNVCRKINKYLTGFNFDSTYDSKEGSKSVTSINSLSTIFTKWSDTFKQFVGNLLMNCLSVFGHFVRLVLKGLSSNVCDDVTDFEVCGFCKITKI